MTTEPDDDLIEAGDDLNHDGDNDDTVAAGAGSDTVSGGLGNDHLAGGEGDDDLQGGEGNDDLDGGDGDDLMHGGVGADILLGGLGNDSLDGGNDDDNLDGGDGDDHLEGGNGNDLLRAGAGNDLLNGGNGDDTLEAGGGNDTLNGGAGNDEADLGGAEDDYIVTIVNGAFVLTDALGNAVTLSAIESLKFADATHDLIKQKIMGSGQLDGDWGDDDITGSNGDDTLDGSLGADKMSGGQGDDDYSVDNAKDKVVEKNNGGHDSVTASVNIKELAAFVEDLVLTGDAHIAGGNKLDNHITGSLLADTLSGGGGDDLFDSQGGGDKIDGGAGTDTAHFTGAASDYDLVALGKGAFDLYDGATLVAHLTGIEEIEFDDVSETLAAQILKGAGAIDGGWGDDNITGGSGDDTIDGGAGRDKMAGGAGNDTYIVDDAKDTVTEKTAAGTDTIASSVSYKLSAFVENLLLTGIDDINGTGNDLANMLTGNTGNNVLTGGKGADTFVFSGAWGSDTVADLTLGDHIDLTGLGYADRAAFEGAGGSLSDGAGGADLTLGTNHIHLTGVTAAAAWDFLTFA
ncbi:MAG: calcium-binding protein [Solirubrobacterales bacterium]